MEITWGVPTTTRVVKEERFDTPVVSLTAIKASKAARKFTFNKAAKEALGLTDYCYVMLGFADNKLVIKNLGNFDEGVDAPYGSFTVSKILTFSDKKIFEHIIKINNLDMTIENHIKLEAVENQPFMIQSEIISDSKEGTIEEAVKEPVKAEETTKEEPKVKKVVKAEEPAQKPEPEVEPEVAPERVKFAVDNTEDDSWNDEADTKDEATEEEEVW